MYKKIAGEHCFLQIIKYSNISNIMAFILHYLVALEVAYCRTGMHNTVIVPLQAHTKDFGYNTVAIKARWTFSYVVGFFMYIYVCSYYIVCINSVGHII